MRSPVKSSASLAALLFLFAGKAAAADIALAINAEGAATHMLGDPKTTQFGWGATGIVAPELKLGRWFGIELPLGVVGLSESTTQDPQFARSGAGSAIFAMPGLRLRPFAASKAGWGEALWVAGGGGVAGTGGVARPSLDVRAGVDMNVGGVSMGPFGGMIQIVEPDQGARPEDARLAILGLHASFEPLSKRKDADRDGDGIPDSVDKCPDDPEDFDGFQDTDGCPDLDNDGDGIPDAKDNCPNAPEDFDGFQDTDGCPDLDNDGDGIPDATDRCPNDPEDIDGFQDADGCPDPDNDGDGIPDATDKCPNEAETFNGFADDDGCPDEEQVRVTGDRIVLDDRVHFAVNQSEILLRSYPLLGNVAKLLVAHPEYEVVQVDGHADDTGAETYNLKLSEARARSVKALLTKFGVPEARLQVEFFGESKPRAEGQTVGARRQNRRVEFEIVRRRGDKLPAPLAPRTEKKEMGR